MAVIKIFNRYLKILDLPPYEAAQVNEGGKGRGKRERGADLFPKPISPHLGDLRKLLILKIVLMVSSVNKLENTKPIM